MKSIAWKSLKVLRRVPEVLLALAAMGAPLFCQAQVLSLEDWLESHRTIAVARLIENATKLEGAQSGLIVASPSKEAPDYFYHWVRDGALAMDVMASLSLDGTETERSTAKAILESYVTSTLVIQTVQNKSGGLGEPKFHPTGKAFDQDWGRPQNDGPALRALTLIRWATICMLRGDETYVRKFLFDSKLPSESAIKRDLEYVANHIEEPSFDPWEEVMGNHFYHRLVQRAALEQGATLARQLGDTAAAEWYEKQGNTLGEKLLLHLKVERPGVVTTLDQKGGWDHKRSNFDASSLLAALHTRSSPRFSERISHPSILTLANSLVKYYRTHYQINRGQKGILLGRYPEDVYDGVGFSAGHAWILTTLGLAEYYYELARHLQSASIPFNQEITSHQLVRRALRYSQGSGRTPILSVDAVSRALFEMGDHILLRLKDLLPSDGNMYEQLDRSTGESRGASHLSWSYVSFITALKARESCRAAFAKR